MYKHIRAVVKVLLVALWLDHMEAASNSIMVVELKHSLDNLILANNLLEDLNLLEANNCQEDFNKVIKVLEQTQVELLNEKLFRKKHLNTILLMAILMKR